MKLKMGKLEFQLEVAADFFDFQLTPFPKVLILFFQYLLVC